MIDKNEENRYIKSIFEEKCIFFMFLYTDLGRLIYNFHFVKSIGFLVIFITFKCGIFSKIKMQGLPNDQYTHQDNSLNATKETESKHVSRKMLSVANG